MQIEAKQAIQHGDMVRCLRGSIDRNIGAGSVGRVTGFARFSAYHPREACVAFDENPADGGWFWLSDLEPADELVAA